MCSGNDLPSDGGRAPTDTDSQSGLQVTPDLCSSDCELFFFFFFLMEKSEVKVAKRKSDGQWECTE